MKASSNRRDRLNRRDSFRRTQRNGSRFYEVIDTGLPFRLTFVSATVMIAIVFVVFATTCFAAITLSSASEKLENARTDARSCAGYYAAESTAVDILTILASDDGNSLADKNGELKYRPDSDTSTVITISRNGGSFSFDVPLDVPLNESAVAAQSTGRSASDTVPGNGKISAQKNLHVIAQITEGNINVIEWYLRDTD